MRHIHKSIVSSHLATRGNNKIHLHHTLAALKRYFPLTRRTLAQLRTTFITLTQSERQTHPSSLCPPCNTYTHNTHHLFNCTHIRTTLSPRDLLTDHAGVTALLTRKAALWTTSWKIGFPPIARVMGVGRQQQQNHLLNI